MLLEVGAFEGFVVDNDSDDSEVIMEGLEGSVVSLDGADVTGFTGSGVFVCGIGVSFETTEEQK